MSDEQRPQVAPQFTQSQPNAPERVDLGVQYKSIGISAVSAAASFGKRKTPAGTQRQMS